MTASSPSPSSSSDSAPRSPPAAGLAGDRYIFQSDSPDCFCWYRPPELIESSRPATASWLYESICTSALSSEPRRSWHQPGLPARKSSHPSTSPGRALSAATAANRASLARSCPVSTMAQLPTPTRSSVKNSSSSAATNGGRALSAARRSRYVIRSHLKFIN